MSSKNNSRQDLLETATVNILAAASNFGHLDKEEADEIIADIMAMAAGDVTAGLIHIAGAVEAHMENVQKFHDAMMKVRHEKSGETG